MRDKESTAITITLPLALDRALQALADQKHCGNKSAAIREVLYKEAGMQAKLRMSEKKDNDSLATPSVVPSNTDLAKRKKAGNNSRPDRSGSKLAPASASANPPVKSSEKPPPNGPS